MDSSINGLARHVFNSIIEFIGKGIIESNHELLKFNSALDPVARPSRSCHWVDFVPDWVVHTPDSRLTLLARVPINCVTLNLSSGQPLRIGYSLES